MSLMKYSTDSYREVSSTGVLKDCDMFPKRLIPQTDVMFPLSREQVHLVSVQTFLLSPFLSVKMKKAISTQLDKKIRLILICTR